MIAGLEILELHATGGMAEVWKARGRGSDGAMYLYAVKRILDEFVEDVEKRAMFQEEARIAARLIHPNIVRVYDLAQAADAQLFIVMEFLEGRTLFDVTEAAIRAKRPLPVWFAVHVAREVLKALDYANTEATDTSGRKLAVVHRDVSPQNVLLAIDGQVKLADFGIAKVSQSDRVTRVGVIKGKFGYLSPEQLATGPIDGRSDLFNVGILLFEMLENRRLYAGATPAELVTQNALAEIPRVRPSQQVPSALADLVNQALRRARDERPRSARSFLQALDNITGAHGLARTRADVAALCARGPANPPSGPFARPVQTRAPQAERLLSAEDESDSGLSRAPTAIGIEPHGAERTGLSTSLPFVEAVALDAGDLSSDEATGPPVLTQLTALGMLDINDDTGRPLPDSLRINPFADLSVEEGSVFTAREPPTNLDEPATEMTASSLPQQVSEVLEARGVQQGQRADVGQHAEEGLRAQESRGAPRAQDAQIRHSGAELDPIAAALLEELDRELDTASQAETPRVGKIELPLAARAFLALPNRVSTGSRKVLKLPEE